MKLALIPVRNSKEPLIILNDEKNKPPPTLMLGWAEQLSCLLVLAVASLWLWFWVLEPAMRKEPRLAVRVPRAQQVVSIEGQPPLKVGDTVLVSTAVAPRTGTIAALPRQSVHVRDARGVPQFVMLGADGYYITGENGAGKVLSRADIRGVVLAKL